MPRRDLAHDLAGVWMELGDYENALRVLQSLLQRQFVHDPLPRLIVCASAVRAAAGKADADAFERLARELESVLARAVEVTVRHGPALVVAARGAAIAGDRARLERWTKLAAGFGERMQQPDVVEEARTVGSRPSPPATASSRVRRNEGLANKTLAALVDSPPE